MKTISKLLIFILSIAMLFSVIGAFGITASAAEETWVETAIADIKSDDVVVMTWTNSSGTYAVTNSNGASSAPAASKVTVSNGTITSAVTDALKWNISKDADGYYVIHPNGDTAKWLYCTSTNNGVRVGTNASKTFKIDGTSGYLVHTGTNRYLGIYNSQDLRCYTSINTNIQNQSLVFYVLKTGSTGTDVPACDHANKVAIGEAKDATCTEKGITAGVKCSSCSEVIEEQVEIPALGHNYVDGVCSVCGEKLVICTLVTNVNELKVGDQIVIAAAEYDYAISTTQNNNNRGAANVVKSENTLTISADVQVITLEEGVTTGTFAFYTGSGYLYAASNSSNHLKTQTSNNENGSWFITVADGIASIVANRDGRNTMQYNPNNGSPIFSCYGGSTMEAICIYKVADVQTEEAITEIGSVADLQEFAATVNAGNNYEGVTVTLKADLDLTGIDWTSIGNGTRSGSGFSGNAFAGTFDGGDHTISGLAAPLFGGVTGTVKNVNIVANINDSANDSVGAAVAILVGGTVDDVDVSGTVVGVKAVGGVVGRVLATGTVKNCDNSAVVTCTGSSDAAGGIVGKAYYTSTAGVMNIENCTNSGAITSGYAAGGIVGFSSANVKDCINTGDVKSTGMEAGGIVGEQTNYGTISGNKNSGDVNGGIAGGIIGWVRYQTSTANYPLTETIVISDNENSGDISSSTALNALSCAGGIVGNIYNQATVTGNNNTAEKISAATFAGGIVGALQPTENNVVIEGATFTVTGNTTTTTDVTANCADLVAYNNVGTNATIKENVYPVFVAEANGVKYETLEAAIAAGGDVTLLADVTVSDHITVATGTDVTIDLAGFDITVDDGALNLYIEGKLTMIDSNGDGVSTFRNHYVKANGELIVDGAILQNVAANTGGYAIYNSGTLTINSGVVRSVNTTNYAISAIAGSTVTINGGEIYGRAGIAVEGGTLTVNDGKISCTETVRSTSHALWISSGEVTVNGGTFEAKKHYNGFAIDVSGGKLVINDGTFIGYHNGETLNNCIYLSGGSTGTVEIKGGNFNYGLEKASSSTGSFVVSGGTFGQSVAEEYCAEGYIPVDNGNGTYGVKEGAYVAEVNGTKFESLADAIAVGGEVKLLCDVALTDKIVVTGNVTLDLAGFKLSYTSTTQGKAMITNKGTLVINDSVGGGEIYYNYVGEADSSYSKGNYTISNGGHLTVNGGKIYIANLRAHAKYPIDNNSTTGDAILVINGGHLYNYNTSAIRQFCNSTTNKNSVTITGGLIEGYCAIWVQNPGKNTVNGSLAITGGEIKTTAAAYINGTSALEDVSSSIYFTIAGEGGAWSAESSVAITGGIFNENVDLAEEAPAAIEVEEAATFNGRIELPITYVAEVDGVKYTDIQEAIKAAAPAGTVKLLSDVTVEKWIMFSESLSISSGQIITLEIDGLTIDGNGYALTVNSVESATNGGYLFYDATELNIKNLTINYPNNGGGIGLTSGTIDNVVINGGNGIYPGAGNITITCCEFNTSGSAIYFETERDNLVVDNNTFNTAAGQYAIYLRGAAQFTNNIVISGKVNVTNSATGEISGNDFGTERFKVYNGASATISNNVVNNLVFNDATATYSEFVGNTLSTEAQAALDAVTPNVAIGEAKFVTLAEAVDAASAGETITILNDIVLTETLVIAADDVITIDLNGKTVSMVMAENATSNHTMIKNKGDLTIKDSVGGGKMSYKYTGASLGTTYSANTITSEPASSLTLNGGTIENLTYDSGVIAYAIDGLTNGGAGDVIVIINGGTVTSERQALRIFANSTTHTGKLYINGGVFVGRVIVQNANAMANNAVLEIKDGTFKTNAYKTDVLYVGGSNGATINMQPVVEGGKFEGSISSTVKAPFITGGTYAEDVSELCKAEYLCKENTADGTFGVSIDPIYVYVKYYGRSIRYATDNGPEPTNCVDLRVSYNLGEEVIKWGWTYRLGNSEEMNLDGVYRSATNFSNIVFSNVAFVNLEKNISVKLWVVVEIDGVETRLEETNFHVFTTYDVLDIMATEYPEDPAGVYSQSVLAEYQAYKSNQEIAMLNDEEND